MIQDLIRLFHLLTSQQRHTFYKMQILVVMMSVLEIVSISSIGPFLALITNPTVIETNLYLSEIYQWGQFEQVNEFILTVGGAIVLVLLSSSLFAMFTIWKLSRYSFTLGAEISSSLLNYYLQQDWVYHLNRNSSLLVKNIAAETQRLTAQVLLPFVHMIAKFVLALFIGGFLFIYNFKLAALSITVFVLAYLFLFRFVKQRLVNNGFLISSTLEGRYQIINEGLLGVRDILMQNLAHFQVSKFAKISERYARAASDSYALAFAPRYLMEMLTFGGLLLFILVLIYNSRFNLQEVFPVLGVFGLAAFKLLPSLQHVYSSLSEIRANISSFYSIEKDLAACRSLEEGNTPVTSVAIPKISFKESIIIKDISFSYPEKSVAALAEINFEIKSAQTIGIVGYSGSGKSTLVNILTGLLAPQQGYIEVDGIRIDSKNRVNWRSSVGYVSQNIFLSDASVMENIAFGVKISEVDQLSLNRAIEMAHLKDLIEELPEGVLTRVGENGFQMSGGQRQRISIARALYRDPAILIFDEATSALDNKSEEKIMETIADLSKDKTIVIVAHRLNTIKNCNQIIFLLNGRIKSQGTFTQLMQQEDLFAELARSY